MLHRMISGCSILTILILASPCVAVEPVHDERTRGAVGGGDTGREKTGHWNSDGSYTDSNGYIVDDAGRGRGAAPANDYPYVHWQTSDSRFNTIMNRIENNPGSCLSPEEADYAETYMTLHYDIQGRVAKSWLPTTKFCPAESLTPLYSNLFPTGGYDDRWNAVLARLSRDSSACMSMDDRRIMESVAGAHPEIWFTVAKYDLSSRFCR